MTLFRILGKINLNTIQQQNRIPLSIELLQFGKTRLDQFKQSLKSEQREKPGSRIEAAYAIQSEIHELRITQGDQLIGYKVGCVSETIQESLNIREPVFGRLYASECFDTGTTFPLNQFNHLAIEGELAIRLNSQVENDDGQDFGTMDIIHSVFPVIELHHFPFEQTPSAADLVALNAIHAGFVHDQDFAGNKKFPDRFSIRANGSSLAQLSGEILFETLDKSLRWLAGSLAMQGLQMRESQFILCGSVANLFPLPEGGHVEVVTDSCGFVECIARENVD